MFNFLEKADLLKEKKKERKLEYGKELQLQIENNKLKKLQEKDNFKIENSNNIGLFLNEKNGLFDKKRNNYKVNLQKLKTSINDSLIKSRINNKLLSLKRKIDNNYNNKNLFYNVRVLTENDQNQVKDKYNFSKFRNNELFKNYNNIDKNIESNNEQSIKKSLSQILKNIPIRHNNIMKNKISFDNNNLIEEIKIQSLFNGFVEQQIRTINDYATNIENIFYYQYTKKNTNINIFNFQIKNEKNNAMESIKKEKNKLKSKFGFFPIETIYDLRIEQLFNKILNKIISIYSSINQAHINNYINQDNSRYNLSNINSRNLFNNSEYNCNDIENDLQMNKNNISKSTKLNSHKFLFNKINLDEDLYFLDFWKKKFETEIMNAQKKELNINETINLRNINDDIINKKEKRFHIMPANDFFKNVKLRKINGINNNKKESHEMKLPDIYLKENIFRRRNKSANNKNNYFFFK